MKTNKENVEKLAKKHRVKFEHLVGRTELYLGDIVHTEILKDLSVIVNESKSITLITRGSMCGIVAVVDYSSDLVFQVPKN